LAAVLFFSGCVYLPQPALPDAATLPEEQRAAQNERVFDAAWDLVRRGYFSATYNDVDWSAARTRHLPAARAATDDAELYAAINALLAELKDDHTHALTARETEDMFRDERVLLGLLLRPINDETPIGPMLVFGTIAGSNAAESGIEPGWLLLSCDGNAPRDVLGAGRLREAQVVRCIFRDRLDQEREIPLTARRLSTGPALISQVFDDGTTVLRFDKFDSGSARWLRTQLKAHASAPGVVLDLRQNPGGDAAALGRMLGEFFPQRVDMGTFVTRRGIDDRLYAWRWVGSARYRGPVAVLVSGSSASSAEIFSAVMQFHHRAKIFGEQTSGVVLASRFFPLPGNGRLQLSIDDYLAPDGRRLEGNGVTPDQVIAQTADDLRAGRDPVLEAGLKYVRATARAQASP
jgi:carboxyl-terminal processing protease